MPTKRDRGGRSLRDERPTPAEFLAAFSPVVRALAEQLRQLIQAAVPHTVEAVYPGWRLIGCRQMDRPGGRYFCFIAPMPDHVRLGFEYGVALVDEYPELEGTGIQVCYLAIRDLDELDSSRLRALVVAGAFAALNRGRP